MDDKSIALPLSFLKILRMIETSILLHRVVYAMDRAADRRLRDALGISHRRAALLRAIGTVGPSSQHDLAARLGHTDPAITSMVRSLRADGLVEVTVDPSNRRRRLVRLTDEGEALVARATSILGRDMAALVRVSRVDLDALRRQLVKLDTHLSEQVAS